MTRSFLQRQSELPHSIPLFRYTPARADFSLRDLNPSLVRSVDDLPDYLILGNLARSTFEQSTGGWSARWQGTEDNIHFDVAYNAATEHWEVRQTWRGVDGGFALYRTRVPLDKVIGQAMYFQFPRDWDQAAKSHIESGYQVTYAEEPAGSASFCGIPDGAFRTIIVPVAVRNLRPSLDAIRQIVEGSALAYPVSVEAKLVFQAVNYVEGKAPEWTADEVVAFNQSLHDTGLPSLGFPVRETGEGGTAAWTLRRKFYFLSIVLPFAGLTDFLARAINKNGPIRAASDPDLRFELRPVIVPTLFAMRDGNIAVWDAARTTRSFLQFDTFEVKDAPTFMEQFVEGERNCRDTLTDVEAISESIVAEVERIYRKVTGEAS